ncbi:hypothetical protein SAMN05421821_10476 [Mucilaginibacter lappiensis]|uniref:Uncharacterized protein n=1 Tax=Mucilaginibacter lappiensis TaxID=354630 RepID=A0A1N6WQM5_9SPHI|nr:hypothetical protein [Mucilaginibacter lappiensis]MBB6127749.1 hypothetical protein [Mucilaginibacter lappiensis]SIQ92345.1 hypothetical protein SAMN05421821_10476 [Mucilaginibacter lappiensis]
MGFYPHRYTTLNHKNYKPFIIQYAGFYVVVAWESNKKSTSNPGPVYTVLL